MLEEGLPYNGAERIAAERRRQIEEEGYTPEHDSSIPYEDGALWAAASCYLRPAGMRDIVRQDGMERPVGWPWVPETWKPTPYDRVRELEKAGALIAAEIDRLLMLREEQG